MSVASKRQPLGNDGSVTGRDRYAAEDLTQDTFIKAFQHDANVMNSALDSALEKMVDKMGASRATKFHQMLTRETIIMDRATFSDTGSEGPALGPDPRAEQVIQSDFKQLFQMFPTQVKYIQAHLQWSANIPMVNGMNDYIKNQATSQQDWVRGSRAGLVAGVVKGRCV